MENKHNQFLKLTKISSTEHRVKIKMPKSQHFESWTEIFCRNTHFVGAGMSFSLMYRDVLKVPLRSNFDTPFFLQKCKLEVSNKQRAKPFSDTKLGSISFEARFLMFFRPPLFKCESPRHAVLNTKLADMTSMTQPIQMKLVQIVSRLVDFFRSRLLVALVFKKFLTQA